jgi:homopolymeric O-antigen transport system permease protein
MALINAHPDRWVQYFNPLTLGRNLWCHRDLICQFTRREIEGRYKGSFLGLFWSFGSPLVLLLTYTFVFGVIFKSRWPHAQTNNLGEYALVLFCGLIAFNIFSESVNRATGLIVGVPNYVKKVVFPLEVLAISTVGSALFHGMVSLSVLLTANLLANRNIQLTLVFLPVAVLPLIFLTLGLTWFLSGLGVFVRDINYAVMLIVQVSFFVTPIFYSVEAVPEPFQTIIRLNPLASIIENLRRVILWGKPMKWVDLIIWFFLTGGLMIFGYAWFMKTKKAFADVI